jgi:arylsulfatase A-like enzyme
MRMDSSPSQVRAGDVELTTVLTLLNTHGISTSTLVVYSSDHGSDGKFSTYEAGLRVPLIMRLPGVIPNGGARHATHAAASTDDRSMCPQSLATRSPT